jgi:hypothetical protein
VEATDGECGGQTTQDAVWSWTTHGLSRGSSTSALRGMSACLNARRACASVINMISYLSASLRLRELGRLGGGACRLHPFFVLRARE